MLTTRDALSSIFISWDFLVAGLVTTISIFVFPNSIPYIISGDIFLIGISVLSIIFAVYFAALAILITGGDNEFIKFLQKDHSYTHIIWTFWATLIILFVALLISLVLYFDAKIYEDIEETIKYPKTPLFIYIFWSSYGLLATLNASFDAIKYAELRAKFVGVIQKK